jgi:hypothetical protein
MNRNCKRLNYTNENYTKYKDLCHTKKACISAGLLEYGGA